MHLLSAPLALALATVALLLVQGLDAGRQCSLDERQGLELVRVNGPGRILLETSGVRKKQDCYTACCHASSAGCNAATYTVRGRVGVCQLLLCEPFNTCQWKPAPHSMVARIKGIQNKPTGPPGVSVVIESKGGSAKPLPPKNTPSKDTTKALGKGNTEEKKDNEGKIILTVNKPPPPPAKNVPPKPASTKTVLRKPTTGTKDNDNKPVNGTANQGNKKNAATNIDQSKMAGTNKGPVKDEPAKKSKGLFESLRDFLLGNSEPLPTKPENSEKPKAANAGNSKINEQQKSSATPGKKNTQGSSATNDGAQGETRVKTTGEENGKPLPGNRQQKKLSPEEKKKLEESIRQKEFEKKKAQELAKQKAKSANQKPNSKVQPKPKQASNVPVVTTTTLKITNPADDDFNILPANTSPINNGNTQTGNTQTGNTQTGKNQSGNMINNNNNNVDNNNNKHVEHAKPAQPSPNANQWKMHQMWKQEQARKQQEQAKKLQAARKANEDRTRASMTTMLVGACAAAVMALLVMVAVCKKVWSDDVASYRPLRNYDDTKGSNDQRQMLLGSGQRINNNSI